MALPIPTGVPRSRLITITYRVLMIIGRIPLLPLLAAEYVVVRKSHVICGRPLTRMYPMTPINTATVIAAETQIKEPRTISFFLFRIHLHPPFGYKCKGDVDKHNKYEKNKSDGKQGLPMQSSRCISHFKCDTCRHR